MKFCPICENMLYMSVTSDNPPKLRNYCRNCSYETVINNNNAEKVSSTNINQDVESYKQYMTKNIKYDMTLPRVNNIKCNNNTCKSKEQEVIYIKYDQVNMKYLYFCCNCESFWTKQEK